MNYIELLQINDLSELNNKNQQHLMYKKEISELVIQTLNSKILKYNLKNAKIDYNDLNTTKFFGYINLYYELENKSNIQLSINLDFPIEDGIELYLTPAYTKDNDILKNISFELANQRRITKFIFTNNFEHDIEQILTTLTQIN